MNNIVLLEANQFLRYRAESQEKVEAQARLMDELLSRPDAPSIKAVLLRAVDANEEYPWVIVKSGTYHEIGRMRNYSGFKEVFRTLFGDEPFSIAWADYIVENCPGPGEVVTALGREKYAQITKDIGDGLYAIERHLGPAGR